MTAGLRVFNADASEALSVTSSLPKILGDYTQTYSNASSIYTGTVTNEGLKIGTAWWFIYAVRYQEDTGGAETDIYRVEVAVDRVNGVLTWTAYGYLDVTTLEIRVVYGVR